MAAKRTSELIPLCHPLQLSHVEVTLEVVEGSVEITASAETTAQTGVEMEALVAASVAALTVYDMAKAIDKSMSVTEITLVEKTKEPTPRSIREVPQFSTLAKRRGNIGKSTARIARHVTIIMAPR